MLAILDGKSEKKVRTYEMISGFKKKPFKVFVDIDNSRKFDYFVRIDFLFTHAQRVLCYRLI